MPSQSVTRRRLLSLSGSAAISVAAAGLLAACGAGGSASVGSTSGSASAVLTTASAVPTSSAASTTSAVVATTSSAAAATTASAAASTTTKVAATSSTAAATASSSSAAAPVVHANAVDFWHWGSGYQPGFTTLVKEYNDANPKNQVVRTFFPDYWNKVLASMAGGGGPDVFLMNNTNFKSYARLGNVAVLDSFLNTDKTAADNLKPMLAASQDWYHYNGKLMGTPWDYSCGIVSYNLDMLKFAGLTPPGELGKKWDWNTLRDYTTKLTQKQGANETRSGIWVYNGTENGWYTFSVASGGSFFNAALDQCTIASQEAIAGLDFLISMMKDGIAAPQSYQDVALKANNDDNNGEIFTNGATAMMLDGDWMFQYYEKVKSLSWDSTIFPYSPAGKTANTSNLRGLVMTPAAKNKDNTWAFMSYLMTKAVQDRIPSLFAEVPANNDSAKTYYFDSNKAGPPPGRNTLAPDLDATAALPASPWIVPTDLNKITGSAIGDAFTFKISAADALKKIQDGINGVIATNKGK